MIGESWSATPELPPVSSRLPTEYLLRVAGGQEPGAVAGGIRAALRVLSWGYLGAVDASAFAHRAGVLRRVRAECPVIAIGNLTSGGTGKTTATAAVAGWLREAGLRPVVLSRGYGAKGAPPVRVVSDGERVFMGPAEGGDEPVMLARRLPGVPVLIGRRRPITARVAVEQFGADVCLLDDGFQVWNLVKDLEIVLLDSRRAFDNGFVLPRGMLREPPRRLSRAGAVVLMDPDRAEGEALAALRKRVRKLAPAATVAEARRAPERLWSLDGGEGLPLAHLRGLPVVALSAIGNPEGFEALLQSLGARVYPARLPDHHHYTAADLERAAAFARRAGAAAIVTTDKDAVKIRALGECGSVGVWECGSVGAPSAPAPPYPHTPILPHSHTPTLVLSIRLDFLEGEETLRHQVLAAARRTATR